MQAGPNGAENNHDLCYAFSEAGSGYALWRNGEGEVVADLRGGWGGDDDGMGKTVSNGSRGVVAFEIPRGSGLMNQEAQAVDQEGGVHVLNRDSVGCEGGRVWWKHYYRGAGGEFCGFPEAFWGVNLADELVMQVFGSNEPFSPLLREVDAGDWLSVRTGICTSSYLTRPRGRCKF